MMKITYTSQRISVLLHVILMVAPSAQILVQIKQKYSKMMSMEVAKVSLLLNLNKDLSFVLVFYKNDF